MIQEKEIRDKLAEVSAGRLPLWDFHNWIERASLNMHRDSSERAMNLVGSVDLLFADFDLGELNASALLSALGALISPFEVIQISPAFARINAAPSVRWVGLATETQLQPVLA